MDKFILIDGNSLINRAYYATPLLSTKSGTPTNALFGFLNMLIKLINDYKPKYLLVAFDMHAPTFRHKLYPEYKGTRKPSPDDLHTQIALIKDILPKLNIATYQQEGFEADDIIGSMSKKFYVDTYIVTGDRDSFQLVDKNVTVLFTKRGISELDVYRYDNFFEKVGVLPNQIVDLKSCMGDSSDNIPGMKGVGEKTALFLVNQYGSLEGIYNHVEELCGKLKENVLSSKDSAYLSKNLATIDTNMDIVLNLDDVKCNFPFSSTAKELFKELELFVLLKKNEIFSQDDIEIKNDFQSVQSVPLQTVEEISRVITNTNSVALYLDNENIHFYNDTQVEYSILIKDNFFDNGLMYDEAINAIKPLFLSESTHLIVYDNKKLRRFLLGLGIEINAKIDDVMLEKYLVDFVENESDFNTVIRNKVLDENTPAYHLFNLDKEYKRLLNEENITSLYENVELPLSYVLFDMENYGFKIDVDALDKMSKEYKERIDELLLKIKEYAEEDFNPNSPKQLGQILFEKLNIGKGKKTKNGYSTSADVLEELKDKHPIVETILKYRQLQKLYSTYVEGFRPLINQKTGIIHTIYNQALTTTGRLSSKEPNLQNIPVRDEEGKEIRKLFAPSDENHILISADYSQIELRLLAHFSNCDKLRNAFISGEDVHTKTACEVFGVTPENVTPSMRRDAKAVNFGIIYGISEYGLSKNIDCSVKKAKEYIDAYFNRYPEVKEYMQSNVEFARKNGYVQTLLGRRRYIREINSSNYNLRSFGERASMNMPLQGTSADIIKIAMINVFNRLKKEKCKSKLILQIHDELIIDADAKEEQIVKNILIEEMENAVKLTVPLTVEVSSGKTWFDAK